MKRIITVAVCLAAAAAWTGDAGAWSRGNMAGGSTSHSYGSTSHENRWGGSTDHVAGEGTEHTNVYGGNTAHAYGGGTEHTNMYGGSTYGKYGEGAYHTYPSGATAYHPPGYPAYPTYPAYPPPVAVPYYSSGCYGCAGAAGAVVGVAAGAAVASANTAAATSSAYNAGVAAGSASTAAATSAAYGAGVAAGSSAGYSAGVAAGAGGAVAPASGSWVMGMNYAALPAGSMTINKNGERRRRATCAARAEPSPLPSARTRVASTEPLTRDRDQRRSGHLNGDEEGQNTHGSPIAGKRSCWPAHRARGFTARLEHYPTTDRFWYEIGAMVRQIVILVRFILAWGWTLLMAGGASLTAFNPRFSWLTFCRSWSRVALWIIGSKLKIEGAHNLEGPAVFVSNHESLIDVVFLPGILPRTHKWMNGRQEPARQVRLRDRRCRQLQNRVLRIVIHFERLL